MQARTISVIGLGYVGLPVAVAFGRQSPVIGFDVDAARIDELAGGVDRTREVSAGDLAAADIHLTNNPADLRQADFHIVAVPTPIDEARQPDLAALGEASRIVGAQLKTGDIVVYESTVYPGATEEYCVPLLEQASGLQYNSDFFVGYSPERINPGDTEHRFENITKVVSGCTDEVLGIVAGVYGAVVGAGVHRAPSIRVAEAAKVIENTQRDLNIALMNELALIFGELGIDTHEVLAAAGTKWNFLPFSPGLVGGHCIGVDPYYLTYKAAELGYNPQVILAGRRINDGMGAYIAGQLIKCMIRRGDSVKGSLVTVLGLTFKENVPDLRNTRVVDMMRELQGYGVRLQVHDCLADPQQALAEYGIELQGEDGLEPADAVILAVPHGEYTERGIPWIYGLLRNGRGVIIDVKGVLSREQLVDGIELWRL